MSPRTERGRAAARRRPAAGDGPGGTTGRVRATVARRRHDDAGAARGVRRRFCPRRTCVETIAGPHARVEVLVGPGQSAETYEPTPRQMAALDDAVGLSSASASRASGRCCRRSRGCTPRCRSSTCARGSACARGRATTATTTTRATPTSGSTRRWRGSMGRTDRRDPHASRPGARGAYAAGLARLEAELTATAAEVARLLVAVARPLLLRLPPRLRLPRRPLRPAPDRRAAGRTRAGGARTGGADRAGTTRRGARDLHPAAVRPAQRAHGGRRDRRATRAARRSRARLPGQPAPDGDGPGAGVRRRARPPRGERP